jgi:peptidoglycan/LPS O-acetylase OafA/YrhL
VKRQLTMPVGVVWLVAVIATWVAATALLAPLIKATANHASAGHAIDQAAVSATFACVFVGGPATAAALRVRRRHSQRRAALCGLATAALILLFSCSYVTATGMPLRWAWQTLPPLVAVTVAQLSLALRLGRRCYDQAASERTPPGQAPPGQAGSTEFG